MTYQQGYVLAYTVCTIVFGLAAYYLGYVQGQRREVAVQEGFELASPPGALGIKFVGDELVIARVHVDSDGHASVNDQ